MEEIKGFVDHIIYRNDSNGYSVFVLQVDLEDIVCIGSFPVLNEGEVLLVTGEYVVHPTYGSQFKIATYSVCEPTDEMSIERYLASGAISGIGPALAKRIVDKFGEDTFDIIENDPERLAEIKGISKRIAMNISDQVMQQKEARDAMIFLEGYGISPNLAVKIYTEYGIGLYRIIQANPYKLAEDIDGIGFKTADEIAMRVGINVDSEFRVRGGVLYTLNLASTSGHCFLPMELLVKNTAAILSVDTDGIENLIEEMAVEGVVKIAPEGVYASAVYAMQQQSAMILMDLNLDFKVDEFQKSKDIADISKSEGIELGDMQLKAVHDAVSHGVFVLTGGPGTGKTTTIGTIIKYFENEKMEIALAAPTGRAAKRMAEACGRDAKTIHRLLEVSGAVMDDGGSDPTRNSRSKDLFLRNEENPLEADVIIIDEASMVDLFLLHALLQAIPTGCRLILVGDVNQLPSVGAGNVLHDIIASEQFATVTLDKIFRQAAQSDIVVNAHMINRGELVTLDNKSSSDFFFLKRRDSESVINAMLNLITKQLPGYIGAHSYDIQVLTPTKKGSLGVDNLNKLLQQYLNPPADNKSEHTVGDRVYRIGDKVMQTKNNYNLSWEIKNDMGFVIDEGVGVFNGDMGIIDDINDYRKIIRVVFDEDRVVEYSYKDLGELTHSYAITVHKSQGSEYPAVVMPIMRAPRMLLNRNLLYTAITRAKSAISIVGDETVFYEMIQNNMQNKRYSNLDETIKKLSGVF